MTSVPGQDLFSLGLGFDAKGSGSGLDQQDADAPAQSLLAIRPPDRTPHAPAEDVLAAVRALLSAAGIAAAHSRGVTLRTPAGTTVVVDEGDRALIGRQPAAEVVVTDTRISRRHCEVSVMEESAVIEDLGSTNGTWLERAGVRLPLTPGRPLHLHDGDLIYCEDLLIATVSPVGGGL